MAMNKAGSVVAAFWVVFFMAFSSDAQGDNTLNINLLYSQQNMEKWQNELKELPAYGMEADFGLSGWPINMLVGFSIGKDSGKSLSRGANITVDATHTEVYVGARRYLMIGSFFAPYVGAAVSTVKAEVSGNVNDASSGVSADSTGFLLNAGILLKFGNINIGADFRTLSGSNINLADFYSNANYNQFGIVMGFNF